MGSQSVQRVEQRRANPLGNQLLKLSIRLRDLVGCLYSSNIIHIPVVKKKRRKNDRVEHEVFDTVAFALADNLDPLLSGSFPIPID
jgi:hypothetical protein